MVYVNVVTLEIVAERRGVSTKRNENDHKLKRFRIEKRRLKDFAQKSRYKPFQKTYRSQNLLLARLDLISRHRSDFDVASIPAVIDDLFRGNMKMFADILSSNSIEATTSFTRIPPVPVSPSTEQGWKQSPCFLDWLIKEIMEKSRR